jgi:hypothetical protein
MRKKSLLAQHKELLQEALDPSTPATRLAALSKEKTPSIQAAVTQNPNTPLEALYKLAAL